MQTAEGMHLSLCPDSAPAEMYVHLNKILASRAAVAAAGLVCVGLGAVGLYVFGPFFAVVLAIVGSAGYVARKAHTAHIEESSAEIAEAIRLNHATIEALATAIDARDQIGSGHVQRTQKYAVGLAHLLGMSDDEIDTLQTAALLHDVGKLGVPDHILSKPGRLTPAELDRARSHTTIGASILDRVGFPNPVAPTVRHHHEAWDGTGYPDGLKGNEIPYTARVLAVADAYDAMRSDRPYRKAMTRDEARRQLQNAAGLTFDPHIVQVFLKNLTLFEGEVERSGLGYDTHNASAGFEAEIDDRSFVQQIKLANKEAFTLFELSKEFGEADKIETIATMFTKRIGGILPFDTCAVYLLDDTGDKARSAHVEGKCADILSRKVINVGEGATGYVLKKREPARNVNPDLDFSVSDLELVQEYSTMASLPLIADGMLIGAVSLYSSSMERYGEEHMRLLETVSEIAATAIARLLEHAEVKEHAMTDPMTGLANARRLQDQFEREVSRADRAEGSFQLVMMDLDGFKAVNDSFGHKVGDRLLREIGMVIQRQLREYDFLARYGGDEFVALVPALNGDDVQELCARIEEAVSAYRLTVDSDAYASVGVSIGSAHYPGGGTTFDQLVMAADKAMYRRKLTRKQGALGDTSDLDELEALINGTYDGADRRPAQGDGGGPGLIVELDETHVIMSAGIN